MLLAVVVGAGLSTALGFSQLCLCPLSESQPPALWLLLQALALPAVHLLVMQSLHGWGIMRRRGACEQPRAGVMSIPLRNEYSTVLAIGPKVSAQNREHWALLH